MILKLSSAISPCLSSLFQVWKNRSAFCGLETSTSGLFKIEGWEMSSRLRRPLENSQSRITSPFVSPCSPLDRQSRTFGAL